jgi:hypothetical protein
MTDNSNIDELIKDLRTENSNSSWQSYCDEFEQAIQQELLKARIDELEEHLEVGGWIEFDARERLKELNRIADLQKHQAS